MTEWKWITRILIFLVAMTAIFFVVRAFNAGDKLAKESADERKKNRVQNLSDPGKWVGPAMI